MQCPECNTLNPDQARFCLNCSAALTQTCAECGTELPQQAKFCFHCAAPVADPKIGTNQWLMARASGPRAGEELDKAIQRLVPKELAERLLATHGQVGRERRTVTILFSDIKGSTAMAESLDPEDVMEIMDGAFDVLIEPVYRYEGTLARLMGDAVLAFFGAPIAHEDDPERACRAALDIVAGAQRYAAWLEEERGIRGFDVRVGINTGLVVVGEVGSDLRVEYTAMGDAVNLAARLESAAEPGTVLVSEDTHKLVTPLFETTALGPLEVKGKSEPVAAYRVLAVKPAPGKVRGISGLESPLVGREAEFAALREALERLQAGVGGIVTLCGEAGIGKSRLVAEVRKGAPHFESALQPAAEVRWVEGRCLSYGTSIAYLLWLDVLRGLLGVTAEEDPGKVGAAFQECVRALCPGRFEEVYPFLAAMMSLPLDGEMEASLMQLDGHELKAGTFRAAERLLAAASQRPLALVCEDLHWADPTSMELLDKLLPLTERAPLLIICIFRPEREHRSWRLRETASRDHARHCTGLWLEPLSPAESERLVDNLLWLEHLPEQLKSHILERAEGNPFYLEEVLRSLIEEGAIVQEEATGRWLATRDAADIAIPDTLQGVLMARIDRLREETKRVLQMAAVIGRLFLYRVLSAIAWEERELDDKLLTLQQEELIRERARVPELEYIFKHELTREAAYNGLLKKERRVFHRQVAETLERLFPERVKEQVGLLAYHWERAGNEQKATEYLLQAGDQARLAYAHEEAVDYYQRALELMKDHETEYDRAARTLMQLGLTYDTAFDYGRARQAYEEGFALWQRAGKTIATGAPPTAPHALRVLWDDPDSLDPGLATSEWSVPLYQLFSGLVRRTLATGIVPEMAASWEMSQAGRRMVFYLRDDVYWSDGVPVTAYDFEVAWKRVLDPATGSRNATMLYDLKGAKAFHQGRVSVPNGVGVQALDDLTLAVELEAPVGYLLHLLTYPATYPVPRHVVERHGDAWAEPANMVTNGPFTLESWQRGDSLVLERYPRYQGRFEGNVQRLQLITSGLTPGPEALELYEADRLDVIELPSVPKAADGWRLRHAPEYFTQPNARTYGLAFNVIGPPFDDPRVRRAFAYAIDRERLANRILGSYVLPATGGWVPPGMPGHVAGIALPYDPERGRQLLAEAGYPSGQGFPNVEWLVAGDTHHVVPYLQTQWRENLGVEIPWQLPPWPQSPDRIYGARPVLFDIGWMPDYPDPDNYLRVAVQRFTAWRHEPYLALVEQARRVMDQYKRMTLYGHAEKILAEEVPILPLNYDRLHLLVKPWLKSYPISATGAVFWENVVIEPH